MIGRTIVAVIVANSVDTQNPFVAAKLKKKLSLKSKIFDKYCTFTEN